MYVKINKLARLSELTVDVHPDLMLTFPMAKTPSSEEEVVNIEERKIQKITIKMVSGDGSTKASSSVSCQADECGVDLLTAKNYNRRHRVCERHAKAPVVLVYSIRQRFCQQCKFDDTKRSCRIRLAGHNERRRKSHSVVEDQPH